jgi:DNA-binding MarR family transcriptional regulator
MGASTDAVAHELLDVVPVIMRTIRSEIRSHRSNELTVPLFRTLLFIERHPGVSLLDLAGHLGLTSPSVCKIVDGLVAHALVKRQHSNTDRRKITLALTPEGQNVLDEARTSTQARLADLLASLSTGQCTTVIRALQILQPLFLPARDKIVDGGIKI